VLFFDEGRFGLQPVVARLWAKQGIRSQTVVKPGYKNFYIYSGVSPQSGESFSLFLPWVNTDMMNLFLGELSAHYHDKQVLLFMDKAGWHTAKARENFPNIAIEYLPPYSPELNPIEKLWQWLKRHVLRNRSFKSLEDLMDQLSEEFHHLTNEQLASICHCDYLLDNN
jgi:transposase